MEIDAHNPVVRMCAEAIQAEFDGSTTDAMRLCLRAWDIRRTDYDACIAAHYLARYQETAEDRLDWNRKALEAALAVGDEAVAGFYSSLYLNLGRSYEDIGNIEQARLCYRLALDNLDAVANGPYKDILSHGVSNAIGRLG